MRKIKKIISRFAILLGAVIGITGMGVPFVNASESHLTFDQFVALEEGYREGNWTYIENGDRTVTLTGYTGDKLEGKVVLPETLGDMPVTIIAENALRQSHISSVIIPANVEKIGEAAFRYCTNLSSIIFLGDAPESFYNDQDNFEDDMMEDEPEAIFGCVTAKAYYPPDNETWTEEVRVSYGKYLTWDTYREAFDDSDRTWMYSKNEDGTVELVVCLGSELTGEVVFPSELDGMLVTALGNGIASECSGVESVIIPEEVTTIGDRAFAGCSNLNNIIIPEKVTSIGLGAFSECNSLERIVLPNGVTNIGARTFEGCSSLESIVLPECATNIGMYALGQCENLKEIKLPEGLINIEGYAFEGCSSLETIVLPKDLTSIGWCAFRGCDRLNTINIPQNITRIEMATFAGCENLSSITISENVTYIGDGAFNGCIGLENAQLPEKLKEILHDAFSECSNLKHITIPKNVEFIGDEAFWGCSGLETVRFEGNSPRIGGGGEEYFGGVFTGTTATIYYPAEDETWTEEVIYNYSHSYDGFGEGYVKNENLTWIPYGKEAASPVTAGWKQDSNGWWYQNADGSYLANVWADIDGQWYYFDGSGYMQTGWLKLGSTWYYLKSSGVMACDEWVDGVYYMKSNGAMAVNEWVDNGKYYVNSSGKWVPGKAKVQAGWKQSSNGWWYQNADGSYPANAWASIGGQWYYFNSSGYMQTGWLKLGSIWYYLKSSGVMAHNEWVDGVYYMKSNGAMAINEWVDNGRYYVGSSGKWMPGKTS